LRLRPRPLVLSLLRALGSTIALVVLYYLLPLDESSIPVVVLILASGLAGLVLLVAFQVRSIMKSPFPELRAVGALATSIPLFLLLFAATYFIMDRISAGIVIAGIGARVVVEAVRRGQQQRPRDRGYALRNEGSG